MDSVAKNTKFRTSLKNRSRLKDLIQKKHKKSTPGQIEKAIRRLNAAGGATGRRTLNYTVAIETALVELHPDLTWAREGDFIHSKKRESSASIGFELDSQANWYSKTSNPNQLKTRGHSLLEQ